MKKVQKEWNEVVEELNENLKSCGLDATSLSYCSGLHYHTSRRFLINGVKNRTASSMKLCTFFNIELDKTIKVKKEESLQILKAAEEVLDGTPIQAEFICRLIRSTKKYKIDRKM